MDTPIHDALVRRFAEPESEREHYVPEQSKRAHRILAWLGWAD